MPKRWSAIVLAALIVIATISVHQRDSTTWARTYEPGSIVEMENTVLTPDGEDLYRLRRSGDQLHVSAPATNDAGGLRMAFWPADAPTVEDGMACATWVEETAPRAIQQGVVLRLAVGKNGTVRALTATKNVYSNVTWHFNLHSWDTSRETPFTMLGQVQLGDTLLSGVTKKEGPWHLCARTMGDELQMKVWTDERREPDWGDRDHGGSVVLESEWVYPGKAGWFIGHLPPGGTAEYRHLVTFAADR